MWTKFAAVCAACTVLAFGAIAGEDEEKSLVERLGFAPDARVVILNADDFGMNHATNVGTKKTLRAGGMTSATVMVPCPWFPEVAEWAREHPQANIGLHLTLTSEWRRYKWGPVIGRTAVPGLVDSQGYFHPNVPSVYLLATIEEAEKEIRAQIDKALDAGIDVTHIDSHMGTLQYAPAYHEMYIKVAKDYDLPLRIAGPELMARFGGLYLIDMAKDLGLIFPEFLHMGEPDSVEDTERYWKEDCLLKLPKGKVSEVYIHCGMETPEMQATTNSWRRRSADTEFFSLPETVEWLKEEGFELISYRELRELQRTGKPLPRVEHYGW